MTSIGAPQPTGPVTSMKVQWDSHSRKDTNGLDEDYYNSLMSKLIEDEDTMSGYRVKSDSPYVYDDLINSLYE